MGDLSGEPSMEDILASIKRVIKEGEAPASRRAPPVAPRAEEDVVSHDAILELNEPLSPPPPAPPSVAPRGMDAFEEQRPVAPPPVATPAPSPTPTLAPAPTPAPAPAPTLAPVAGAAPEPEGPPVVSPATVEATRGALGALSRLIVKPEADSDGTLEGLVRDMLRPMLSDWLDQNLPRLVEQMVAREIAKITRQN